MRSAHLYDSESASAYWYVNMNVVGTAFSVEFAYRKRVLDFASARDGLASTWRHGSIGTARGYEFVVSQLSGLLDIFLTEYLRVNEDACDR